MDNILTSVFEPQFSQLTLHSVSDKNRVKNCGITYQLDPSIGRGYYWVQPIRNTCAVAIANLSFEHEVECNYIHPAFLSIGSYAQNLTQYFENNTLNKFYSASNQKHNNLIGSISESGKFETELSKSSVLQYISITMLPKYYDTFLSECFSLSQVDLVESIKRIRPSSEIGIIFSQILKSNPSAKNGELYYESKVIEFLSLLQMQKEQQDIFQNEELFNEENFELIRRVATFIEAHCEQRLSIEFLSKIFYTNKNKLSRLFQAMYQTTIPEYIQHVRMDLAKDLLANSNYPIQSIALQIGYKNQGSFSVCFKSETGFSPSDYRKLIQKNSII